MPSRWLRVLIVGFWLTTTGWLFWHDLWPNWQPGQPPPFSIDPVEEVSKGDPLMIYWSVQRQGKGEVKPSKVFRASTCVIYRSAEDAYVLRAHLDAKQLIVSDAARKSAAAVSKPLTINELTSNYVVGRGGELRSLDAEVKATYHLDRLGETLSPLLRSLLQSALQRKQQGSPSSVDVSARIIGEVRDDRFFAHCHADLPSARPLEFDLPPAPVSHVGSVLMPLHPVNHIRGLRPGQRWRQPLIDPLRDAFAGLPGFSGGARTLNAHVLEEPRILPLGEEGKRGYRKTHCLVIEYRDEDNQEVGRTWVEQDSERVQRQEATLDDVLWIMQRDPTTFTSGSVPNH
jgi:hypothetical protein